MPGLKVLCTIGMRGVLDDVAPAFAGANGIAVVRVYDSSVALMKRIAGGETGDVAVFTAGAIDDLIRKGNVLERIDLSRSFVGIAVAKGAPKPDISTPETFKRALLNAKSIAHSKTGASGLYFAGLIEKLGLADALRAKIKLQDGIVGELAARGEAEIAVQQISELMQADGVDIVGPLPDVLQSVTVFSAGVFKASQQRDTSEAFVAHLASSAVAPVIRRNGMEPV
ncbi:MAG: molybdate transport system substrate-binding protein [Hyphomicrobiales bacterium]|jgi:molybdate transport system substrate-binding protein|nr:molybdate transport system substrate-binding protein [Hyphomicrobiales bacterium]